LPQRSEFGAEDVSLLVPSPEALYFQPAFFMARVSIQIVLNTLGGVDATLALIWFARTTLFVVAIYICLRVEARKR
jgi:hypothetical protein